MLTTGVVLIPSVTYVNNQGNINASFNPGYPNYNYFTANNWVGNPVPAASYYRSPGALQTVSYYANNFIGTLIFEATLDAQPSNVVDPTGHWFTVANFSGLGANTYLSSDPDYQVYMIGSEVFVADGIANTYTLQSYLSNDTVIVSIDGITQIPSATVGSFSPNSSYYVSGQALVFTTAPLFGEVIEVREFFTPIPVAPIQSQLFTAPGNTTQFPIGTGNVSYSNNSIIVSVNGIVQIPIGPNSNIGNVEQGSYGVISSNANVANSIVYYNTLNFNWTPQTGDQIEVREIVTGNVPGIPAFSGAGVLNLEGNFTWIRCRVVNFSQGTIQKITLSY